MCVRPCQSMTDNSLSSGKSCSSVTIPAMPTSVYTEKRAKKDRRLNESLTIKGNNLCQYWQSVSALWKEVCDSMGMKLNSELSLSSAGQSASSLVKMCVHVWYIISGGEGFS